MVQPFCQHFFYIRIAGNVQSSCTTVVTVCDQGLVMQVRGTSVPHRDGRHKYMPMSAGSEAFEKLG